MFLDPILNECDIFTGQSFVFLLIGFLENIEEFPFRIVVQGVHQPFLYYFLIELSFKTVDGLIELIYFIEGGEPILIVLGDEF